MNIEDYLHKIDSSLKDKSEKDRKLTYIMVASVIFAFAYLFWDSSENDFMKVQNEIKQIQSKINKDKSYLSLNPQSKITNLEKDIQKTQIQMLEFKDKNDYIKHKIETISALIYDERTWGAYINSIAYNAKKYNIKIKDFSNKYVDNNESFGHMLDLKINLSGRFQNTLKFINSLEQSDLVVDIHNLDIKAQNKLNTNIELSVWGITY
ncbi:type 4a pilus biogenesis protein PilO [Sulfurimonas lithotrophica]|uniref:Type 4a pilus biogenesis protein PilO n=1 Tax=Sulfurimonas lithotrophica TaxID=2590022 RepID=A0A5P8P086_9BACT|nr:type 4a pilus biogenesis protein PilO [Sulfurimonas lithotrophica]QFR49021.1 type 4a pilus biogenesis protein PilO [Sulfurimonas lithotrophica]